MAHSAGRRSITVDAVNQTAPVIKVRIFSNLLLRRADSGRPSAELRQWIHGRGRGGTCAARSLNTAGKTGLARRRSRVMSNDPAGNESCLGRGRAQMPIVLTQPSPFARATMLSRRQVQPAVAKTSRFATSLDHGVAIARDAPNVPPAG